MPVKNPTFNGKPLPPRQSHQEIRLRGSIASQPLHGPVEAPGPCAHHWRIETPNGPLSEGVCLKCGETKMHRNSEQFGPGDEKFGGALR